MVIDLTLWRYWNLITALTKYRLCDMWCAGISLCLCISSNKSSNPGNICFYFCNYFGMSVNEYIDCVSVLSRRSLAVLESFGLNTPAGGGLKTPGISLVWLVCSALGSNNVEWKISSSVSIYTSEMLKIYNRDS